MINYLLFYVSLENLSVIIMVTSLLLMKGCKIEVYARRSRPFSKVGSVAWCFGFSGFILRTFPLVVSYDKQVVL